MSVEFETNRVLKEHAERIAALETVLQHLATKADIESLRAELKAMRWLIGVAISLASVIFTVVNVLVDLALRT